MTFQMFVIAAALVVLGLHLRVAEGQQGQLGECSRSLEQELPGKCLQANGIDYNGTLFIISGNRTGSIPAGVTYNQFRDLMCSAEKQDLVTPCILQLMLKWNKTTCDNEDRLIMSARGTQLLALMEGFCGDPCEQAAMQTLIQCFAAVQVDPSAILNNNATINTDKFPFVGNNSTSATKFCNSRQRLFTCLSPLANDCPKIVDRLYVLGVDLAGLETGTQTQCNDLDTYLQALKCFNSPGLQQCDQEVELLFQQVQEERYRTGRTKPSQYQGRLCQTKLSKVDCELKKLADSCPAAATEMVSAFECTSLPKPCREGPETLSVYDSICKKVTTLSPTVTQRPTPPKKPVNPDTGKTQDALDGGGSGAGQRVSSASLPVFVLGWAVGMLFGRLM